MREVIEKNILNFIVLPLALKVFQRDHKVFKDFKVGNVYLDKLDAVIEQLQQDINTTKHQMYSVHHINIRKLGKENNIVRYECRKNGEPGIMEFTPEELRKLTSKAMRNYLYGTKATSFERKERMWNN